MRAAPYKDAIKDWLLTGVAPNYCMWGRYTNFIGDNGTILANGKGANWQQIKNIEAHQGQPIEIVMAALSLSLGNPSRVDGLRGMDQHIYLQVALCPNNGTGIGKTTDGTNDPLFDAIVAAINTAGLDHKKITMVLGWEFFFHSFAWANGVTAAQYIAAFRHVATRMRSRGFTGSFMCDMTGGSVAEIAAGTIWPGDDVCDMVGYHLYNGMANTSDRTTVQHWWDTDLKPRLDACTNFAIAHGKLCGASEMGLIVARYAHGSVPADTTSNTYLFHTADTPLYWPNVQSYMKNNCRVWAGITGFFQDLGNPTSEFSADLYFGANPASQPPEHPSDTDQLGTVYDTVAAEHAQSNAAHIRSVMIPGSMQIATATSSGPVNDAPHRILSTQAG